MTLLNFDLMSKMINDNEKNGSNLETQELFSRLTRWVKERSKNFVPERLNPEQNARKQIFKAIQTNLSGNSEKQQKSISKSRNAILKISKVFPAVILKKPDSKTGENITASITYDSVEQRWIGSEHGEDGRQISQTIIPVDASKATELSLTFTSQSYLDNNANPNILHRTDLPCAAYTTFNLLLMHVKSGNEK